MLVLAKSAMNVSDCWRVSFGFLTSLLLYSMRLVLRASVGVSMVSVFRLRAKRMINRQINKSGQNAEHTC